MPSRRVRRIRKALIQHRNRTLITWLGGLTLALAWAATVSSVQAAEGYLASLETPQLSTEPLHESTRFVGIASVVDGDTIEISGRSIELFGIDAPEMEQTCRIMIFSWPCGEDAMKFLSALVSKREVVCVQTGESPDALTLAVCTTESVEINETMVRIGMALASVSDGTQYAEDEAAAKGEEVGVWRSRFDPPWEWRAEEYEDDDDEGAPARIRR